MVEVYIHSTILNKLSEGELVTMVRHANTDNESACCIIAEVLQEGPEVELDDLDVDRVRYVIDERNRLNRTIHTHFHTLDDGWDFIEILIDEGWTEQITS